MGVGLARQSTDSHPRLPKRRLSYYGGMKWLLAVLALAVGAALAALAYDPRTDAICALARIRDAVTGDRVGWQCLHYAAARGDRRAVRAALEHGALHDARNWQGQTPLMLAAMHGRLALVQELIRRGAQLEARDGGNGFTALHWAADRQHPAIARALIAAGAQVDARNRWQQTPLWQTSWQADQGNTEIAHILVAAGADIHAADDQGNSPLLMAARAGHEPMVDYLLELGADIEHPNHRGRTPLFQAVAGNHPDSVRLLLARGADANTRAEGTAALALAFNEDRLQIADLLRANGATGYPRYAAAAAFERGRHAYTAGDYDAAVRAFGDAITLRPEMSGFHYARGLAFMARGAAPEAETDLTEALRLNDDNDRAREALARLYVDHGAHDRAIAILNDLLERQPENARALYLLGESQHSGGETARARAHFRRACALGFEPACGQ